jgi:hypothetical protein
MRAIAGMARSYNETPMPTGEADASYRSEPRTTQPADPAATRLTLKLTLNLGYPYPSPSPHAGRFP